MNEPEYETVPDTLIGGDVDQGRLTGRQLAAWLLHHRDNDVNVIVHGVHVPVSSAHYCPNADSLVLHLMDGEALRVATSFCVPGSPKLIETLERLSQAWKAERPDARGHLEPDAGTLLLWVLGADED